MAYPMTPNERRLLVLREQLRDLIKLRDRKINRADEQFEKALRPLAVEIGQVQDAIEADRAWFAARGREAS